MRRVKRVSPDRQTASRLGHWGLAACLAVFCMHAYALEIWSSEEEERSLTLDTALKFSAVGTQNPDNGLVYPHSSTATGMHRLRLGLKMNWDDWIRGELAYEHRARWVSEDAASIAGGGILPSFAKAPYRVAQLDWELVEGTDRFMYRHEVDRAFVAFQPKWGGITLGRQAIGLGRGVVFSAVDFFAPFSPTEVDREWRRGVDAVRIERHLSDTSSAELIGVFSDRWDESAVLARVRGYVGRVDGELIVGKRAKDAVCAAVMSAAVGDAAVHAEIALFHTPERQIEGGLFGNDRLVLKSVLGGSYTFDVGNGLTVIGEYLYSGFGLDHVSDAQALFQNPESQKRYVRGDTQIMGRHALALQLTYPFSQAWNGSFTWLQSPVDGSGLVSPALTWDFSRTGSLRLAAYVPWGEKSKGWQPASEYGLTPFSLFAQVSMYF